MILEGYIQTFKKKYYHVKVDFLFLQIWTGMQNPVNERNILLGCGGAQAQPQQILKASPYAPSICSCTKNLMTKN